MFPAELELRAGAAAGLFHDERIRWAIERFGDLAGRSVLELGPLEAAHTTMLAKAGAHVDAIEANQLAYFKCLITKEIMDIKNARFFLGDCVLWLEQNERIYDLIVASGVLYHMREPLRLLSALSSRTNSIYLWTVIVNDDALHPSAIVAFNNVDVRLYWRGYGERDYEFCGGPIDHANWMHRDDILAVLRSLGFTDLTVAHEESVVPADRFPTFSVFARRPASP